MTSIHIRLLLLILKISFENRSFKNKFPDLKCLRKKGTEKPFDKLDLRKEENFPTFTEKMKLNKKSAEK